jgi:HlyD family secretion protein
MIKNCGVLVAVLLPVCSCERAQPPEGFQGVVELEERQLAFEVPGRVAELAVRAGDTLAPGRLIARLDDGLARAAVAARQAESEVAEQQWKLVRAGARAEDVRAMQARLGAARAVETLADRNAERTRNLAAAQAVTPAASDEATAQMERARSERQALEQNLRALVRGPRAQELEAALQRSAAAQAGLTLEKERLARHQLHAERAAEVLEVHLEPGEMAAVAVPVITVADVARPYAEVFVPQGRLQGLQPGTPALARVDGVAEEVPGAIELVYRRTEFTPHYLFSESERGNLVVRIRVRLNDPGRRLHAGVPVFVRFQPGGRGR